MSDVGEAVLLVLSAGGGSEVEGCVVKLMVRADGSWLQVVEWRRDVVLPTGERMVYADALDWSGLPVTVRSDVRAFEVWR